ncbi:MAG TPA: tetratricopeptide repeat protein [Bacteroidia bacterium]
MKGILLCILFGFFFGCDSDKKHSNKNNKLTSSNTFFQDRIELVETSLKNKDYQTVILLCDSVLFFDSLQPPAYFYKGKAQSELKEYTKSNLNLMNAIKLGIKDSAKVYFYIANNYLFMEKYMNAMFIYTKVIKINSSESKAYRNRGICYYYINRQQEACSDFDKALILGDTLVKDYITQYCK